MQQRDEQVTWERRTEWPLAMVAIVFLAAYAWPIIEADLQHSMRQTCSIMVYAAWALFAVDYLVRLVLAENRGRFVARHLLDLASIALPVLRPLRLLRLVALVRVLNRRATSSLQGRVAIYVACSASLVVFVAALAALDAERGHRGATITSLGDALWWAATTVMTVGYGDKVPVTAEGRWVAVGLMLGGITLIGVVTASIATWLIAQVRQTESDANADVRAELQAIREDLARLTSIVREASIHPHVSAVQPGSDDLHAGLRRSKTQ
jgi:voltage-gated potassium channel